MGQQLICFCLPFFFLENVVEIALIQSFVFEKFTSRKGLGDCLSLRFGSGHIGRSILTAHWPLHPYLQLRQFFRCWK